MTRLLVILATLAIVMGALGCGRGRIAKKEADAAREAERANRTVTIEGDSIQYNAEADEIAVAGNVVISWTQGSSYKGSNVVWAASETKTLVVAGAKVKIDRNGQR